MVTTFKLNQLIATGVSPCQSNSTHGCFGTGADHAHHFYTGDELADFLCDFRLYGSGGTKAQTILGFFANCSDYLGVGVTQNHGSPGEYVVDVFFPFDIPEVSTLGFFKKHRCAAHRTECTNGRVNSAWNKLLGLLE